MSRINVAILLFACFAFGLPMWAMQTNGVSRDSVHSCSGECYAHWKQQTGGVLALAAAKAEADAAASPAQRGEQAFVGCIACHGANGEGGIGPMLAGQQPSDITSKLTQYRSGETRGGQSALMWSQAAQLDDTTIKNLAAYIQTL
ncbi:MAG: c-type cytochrome [Halioglobus sp.]